jgi:cytoskeletal protein RodZ
LSIGDALAQARGQAGLTVAQVSQRTCIRETIIRGIERDDFSACGGDFYARGHIRSIARAVGTDPEELIQEYDATHGAPQAIRAADVFQPSTPIKLKERRRPNWSLAMIVVLVLLLGYGGYRVIAAATAPSHPVAAGSHRPALRHHAAASAHSPSPSAQAHPRTVVIQLTALQDCWVEFTRPSGRYLTQAYIVGGSTKTWTFRHAVVMQIGNPGGILLTVDGKKLGRPGSPGQPVTLSFGPDRKLPSIAAG